MLKACSGNACGVVTLERFIKGIERTFFSFSFFFKVEKFLFLGYMLGLDGFM